jgi:hypothetical protein
VENYLGKPGFDGITINTLSTQTPEVQIKDDGKLNFFAK